MMAVMMAMANLMNTVNQEELGLNKEPQSPLTNNERVDPSNAENPVFTGEASKNDQSRKAALSVGKDT